jgi:putative transposase
MKLYCVDLSEPERTFLLGLLHQGKTAARKLCRAHVLLLAAEGRTDQQISAALHVGTATVERIRKRFDGKQEALLVALACSTPPEGRRRWTMKLLAERFIELGVVTSLSDETVRRCLKQTSSSPGSNGVGACPK